MGVTSQRQHSNVDLSDFNCYLIPSRVILKQTAEETIKHAVNNWRTFSRIFSTEFRCFDELLIQSLLA